VSQPLGLLKSIDLMSSISKSGSREIGW